MRIHSAPKLRVFRDALRARTRNSWRFIASTLIFNRETGGRSAGRVFSGGSNFTAPKYFLHCPGKCAEIRRSGSPRGKITPPAARGKYSATERVRKYGMNPWEVV